MKPLPKRFRTRSQRGSVGPQATPSLTHLMEQLEGLENRLSQFKTGLSNMLQLQQLQDRPENDSAERQALGETLANLQREVDEFDKEWARTKGTNYHFPYGCIASRMHPTVINSRYLI
jgi:uncharacterized protein (DUF342 family)